MKTFLDNHAGPFRLFAARAVVKKGKPAQTTELLKGSVDRDDVLEEAHALLNDPRDTIIALDVWSEREEQFVGTLTKKGLDKLYSSAYN